MCCSVCTLFLMFPGSYLGLPTHVAHDTKVSTPARAHHLSTIALLMGFMYDKGSVAAKSDAVLYIDRKLLRHMWLAAFHFRAGIFIENRLQNNT